MLASLTVQNFAIIDNINIDFKKGLTVLTGETGAGKSLIIDAIGLLFGNRASSTMIRSGASKAIVEGVFTDCGEKVMNIISEYGLDSFDDGMIVVKREINDNGKSLIRINGSVVTLSQLSEVAYYLADIHTQLDTKKLFDVNNYVSFIDNQDSLKKLERYQELLKEYKNALNEYLEKSQSIKDDLENLDYLKYQLQELDKADLKDNELNDIENEITELNNFENIFKLLKDIKQAFSTNNIVSELYSIKQNLNKLKDYSDNYQKSFEECENLYYELEALEEDLLNKINNLEFDEARLDKLNARYAHIKELMRKHHMTFEELLSYHLDLKQRIDGFEKNDLTLEDYLKKVNVTYKELCNVTLELTNSRKKNAEVVKKNILETLKQLHLEKVNLDIRFNEYQFTDALNNNIFKNDGADLVNFYISFNVGEPLKELSKVASGGEMSRVMLAFKVHLLNNLGLSTIIFDEIDTGVSGVVARSMADKLKIISKDIQVLSITHLPIVASAADNHLYICKDVKDNRTFTAIKELTYDERVEEIAKMISSQANDITSQRLAEDMIKSYKK
ncbi:MAG: DNA repair protein RecN [Bacilli bacterium]|nr:DNA repair protein RecN [Bacilli bacterium]